MFDNVLEASKERFADDAPAEATVAELSTLVADSETLEHGLWGTGEITWTRDNREVALSPDTDGYAFLLVTERRILCVAGDDSAEPSPALSLANVTSVEYRSSLFSSSFAVETADERVSFAPGGGDAETVEDTAENWQHMDRSIENARDMLTAYRDEDGMFGDIWRVGKQIRTHLQTAGRAADRDNDAVASHLLRILDPIAADFARDLRVEAHESVRETDVADDGARETYQQARDVLEFALDIAEEHTTLDVAPFEESLETLEADIDRSEWQWGGAG